MKNRTIISLILATISASSVLIVLILILNVNIKFLPFIKLPASVYYVPIYILPINIVMGVVSHILNKKNKFSYLGLIVNALLAIMLLIFILVGFKYTIH